MIPPTPTWDQLTGPVAALVLAIFFASVGALATYKGWIVPGVIHRQEREDWKAALKATVDSSEKHGTALGKEVAKEMEKAVSKGIETGIAKGYLKLNGNKLKARRRAR